MADTMILTHKLFISALLLALLLPLSSRDSSAFSVAVLPVADLTYARDGVNFTVANQLIEQLQQQGLSVIDSDQVTNFMVRERIRRCGDLDSFSARKMALQLKCDSILVTTIYQQKKTADQSTMMLTLLHGKTGQPVWSRMTAAHLNDSQPLFGFKTQRQLDPLQQQQIVEMAHTLVKELPTLPDPQVQNLLPVQVDDIQIVPQLVRGRNPIQCRFKIDFLETPPDRVQLEGGEQPVRLSPTSIPHVYTGRLTSIMQEGDHPISLSLHWSGDQTTRIDAVTTYRVANRPVKLYLDLYNSIKVGDIYAFSDTLKIHPRMVPKRPLELWTITIHDDQGEVVFTETQHTPLPADMLWRGINKNLRQLEMGYYKLTLTVRDIAGNESVAEAKLYMQSKQDEMIKAKQRIERGLPHLRLSTSESLLIPVNHWRLTLETEKGLPLLSRKGDHLPVTIILPEQLSRPGIVCHFVMRDELGNQYTTETVQHEATIGEPNMVTQLQPDPQWKTDF